MIRRPPRSTPFPSPTLFRSAIAESDLLLFLVDVEQGVHPADLEIAQYLRRAQRPVLLVANKADHLPDDTQDRPLRAAQVLSRSEEHTSELQSRLHLVCRLLL